MELLEKEEVQAGVAAANIKGDQEKASKSSLGHGLVWVYHWLLERHVTPAGFYVEQCRPLPDFLAPHIVCRIPGCVGDATEKFIKALEIITGSPAPGWTPGVGTFLLGSSAVF